MKLLDLFCGAGGASMGYHQAGFDDITGVDINPQPRYPFKFVQADAMMFNLSGYNVVVASPPCQAYTNAQRIRSNTHVDYIATLRTRLKKANLPWCIENVIGVPLIAPVMLCGTMFGIKTYRHRLFETSFFCREPQHTEHPEPSQKMGRPIVEGEYIHIVGHFSNVQLARKVMQIDWMTRDELSEAIPPAYTKYIGKYLLAAVKN